MKLLLKLIELCDLFAFKTAIGDRRKSVVPRTTRNNVALLLFAIAATFCLYFFVLDAISLAKLRIYGSLVVIYTAIYVGKVLALVFAAICLKKDAVRLWSGVLELREYRLPNRPRIWWNLLAVLLLRLSVVLAAAKTNYEFKAGIAVIMCSAMFALVESLSMLTFLKLQALLCLFGGYFRALNANIGEAVTRGNTLRDVAVLHQKLYDLTVALNKNFAAILLVDFAESFVLFIVHVYSVITGLVNNYTWFPTESSVFCTTLAVSRVYSVVVLAEYCSGEVRAFKTESRQLVTVLILYFLREIARTKRC